MIVIRNPEDVHRIVHPHIHALLTLRLQQLGTFHDGLIVVVEAGDVVSDIEKLCGVPILFDPYSDSRYGHADYSPSFDFVIDHSAAYEMHFDASDGIGTTIFFAKDDGIDSELLAMCREFAVAER